MGEEVELSTEELARLEAINNGNLDEVVVARKLSASDKVARAKYLEKYHEKEAHLSKHAVKGDPKSFKQRNLEPGDYSKEPSKMTHTGLVTKQDTKFK